MPYLEELPFDETLERAWIHAVLSCAGCDVRQFVGRALPDGPSNFAGNTSEERPYVKFSDIGVRERTLTVLLDFVVVNLRR